MGFKQFFVDLVEEGVGSVFLDVRLGTVDLLVVWERGLTLIEFVSLWRRRRLFGRRLR